MPAKFKLNDKHIAFCNDIIAGTDNYKAYIRHISPRKQKVGKHTAQVNSSKLLARPEIQKCLENVRRQREEAITKANVSLIPKEFTTAALTTDQLDSFHYSVALGMVDIEEHVVVYTVEEILNEEGRVAKRIRRPNIQKYMRRPNVREKQISIDAIYKRFGSYAATKLFGAFKNVDEEPGEGNVERCVILADGTKLPF